MSHKSSNSHRARAKWSLFFLQNDEYVGLIKDIGESRDSLSRTDEASREDAETVAGRRLSLAKYPEDKPKSEISSSSADVTDDKVSSRTQDDDLHVLLPSGCHHSSAANESSTVNEDGSGIIVTATGEERVQDQSLASCRLEKNEPRSCFSSQLLNELAKRIGEGSSRAESLPISRDTSSKTLSAGPSKVGSLSGAEDRVQGCNQIRSRDPSTTEKDNADHQPATEAAHRESRSGKKKKKSLFASDKESSEDDDFMTSKAFVGKKSLFRSRPLTKKSFATGDSLFSEDEEGDELFVKMGQNFSAGANQQPGEDAKGRAAGVLDEECSSNAASARPSAEGSKSAEKISGRTSRSRTEETDRSATEIFEAVKSVEEGGCQGARAREKENVRMDKEEMGGHGETVPKLPEQKLVRKTLLDLFGGSSSDSDCDVFATFRTRNRADSNSAEAQETCTKSVDESKEVKGLSVAEIIETSSGRISQPTGTQVQTAAVMERSSGDNTSELLENVVTSKELSCADDGESYRKHIAKRLYNVQDSALLHIKKTPKEAEFRKSLAGILQKGIPAPFIPATNLTCDAHNDASNENIHDVPKDAKESDEDQAETGEREIPRAQFRLSQAKKLHGSPPGPVLSPTAPRSPPGIAEVGEGLLICASKTRDKGQRRRPPSRQFRVASASSVGPLEDQVDAAAVGEDAAIAEAEGASADPGSRSSESREVPAKSNLFDSEEDDEGLFSMKPPPNVKRGTKVKSKDQKSLFSSSSSDSENDLFANPKKTQ